MRQPFARPQFPDTAQFIRYKNNGQKPTTKKDSRLDHVSEYHCTKASKTGVNDGDHAHQDADRNRPAFRQTKDGYHDLVGGCMNNHGHPKQPYQGE